MTDALHSKDAFLGGRLHLCQPRRGYRAGVDPVLLAASIPAQPGQAVLDMGCGVGAAALCLGTRVPGLSLTGIEIQPDIADLARRNGAGLGYEVFVGDIHDPPRALKQMSFDHVLTNPPYFDRAHGTPSPDQGRETAMGRQNRLGAWMQACFRRLRPGGWFHMIYRVEDLANALAARDGGMGSWEICPLAARVGRPANLMILRARKDGRRPLRLLAPLVMHKGAQHLRDGEDYTDTIRAVLREAAPLEFPEG